MKWLRGLLSLFGVCGHKWNKINEEAVFLTLAGKRLTPEPSWHNHILQCEHCGNIKSVKA